MNQKHDSDLTTTKGKKLNHSLEPLYFWRHFPFILLSFLRLIFAYAYKNKILSTGRYQSIWFFWHNQIVWSIFCDGFSRKKNAFFFDSIQFDSIRFDSMAETYQIRGKWLLSVLLKRTKPPLFSAKSWHIECFYFSIFFSSILDVNESNNS